MNDNQRDALLVDLLLAQRGTEAGARPPEPIGTAVIVRTVTMHYTGRIAAYDGTWLWLDEAAWLPGWADNPRWATLLERGGPGEVEPYPQGCVIGVGTILDVSKWLHDLPRAQK